MEAEERRAPTAGPAESAASTWSADLHRHDGLHELREATESSFSSKNSSAYSPTPNRALSDLPGRHRDVDGTGREVRIVPDHADLDHRNVAPGGRACYAL